MIGTTKERLSIIPGDIILTRNSAGKNPTPGHWNHAGIVAKTNRELCVVEVQRSFPEVVMFRLESFLNRYPNVHVMRNSRPIHVHYSEAERASEYAVIMVGVPIEFTMTPRRTMKNHVHYENCVSFVRKCFQLGASVNYEWITPDDISNEEEWKNVYDRESKDWTPPNDKWSGRIVKV